MKGPNVKVDFRPCFCCATDKWKLQFFLYPVRKCKTLRNTSWRLGFADGCVTDSDGDEREELIQRQEVSEGQGSNVQVSALTIKI